MQVKKKYDKELLTDILKSQKMAESLIQEILGKVCPLHGLHANIEISENWDIVTVTCCKDFSELTDRIIISLVTKLKEMTSE